MVALIARWFSEGGMFMWLILIVMAFACAITIERLIFFLFITKRGNLRLVSDVIAALNRDSISDARRVLSKIRSPAQNLIEVAVCGYEQGLRASEIIESIEEATIDEIPKLSRRLNYLSLCANISTLLGLLGTIHGLQLSFGSISSVEAAKKATMLAQGISVAMNTTAFGLFVAVPCMVIYTILLNMQQQRAKDIDRAILRLMNYLKKKRP